MAEEWLTYGEIRVRLDKGLDAVRKHVARAGWPRRRTEDGRVLVLFCGRTGDDGADATDAWPVASAPAEDVDLRAAVERLTVERDALQAARESDAAALDQLRELCDEQQRGLDSAACRIKQQNGRLKDLEWDFREKERALLERLRVEMGELQRAQHLVASMLTRDARYLGRGWFGRAVRALPLAHDPRYAVHIAQAVSERSRGSRKHAILIEAPQSP